jgi:cohesin complex subunit SCC1
MAVLNVPAGTITLPNLLTEDDLFANLELDPSLLLSQVPIKGLDQNDMNESSAMDWTSSPLGESSRRAAPEDRPQLEDDFGIELDLGEDEPFGTSIELGRDAPSSRPMGEDLFSDDNKIQEDPGLILDIDDRPMEDNLSNGISHHNDFNNPFGNDDDLGLGGEEFNLPLGNDTEVPAQNEQDRERRSQSQLSSARSSALRELEDSREEDKAIIRQAQRAKKRKLIQPDADTVLHNHQIKEQQQDRSKILKPTSFLPRDPFLLTLINMQKNGDFVSRVMGDGRAKGWAPELRGILSIDIVRKSGELKRKRDSGIADMGEDGNFEKSPRLEFDEEDQIPQVDEGLGLGGDSFHGNSTMIDLPADDGARPPTRDSNDSRIDDDGFMPAHDDFNDTTAPLIHPADSGPVSLGTKHAVHLLRDRFGGSQPDGTPPSQKKSTVLFQDLLPERQTSKVDATKMFFEVLVLATKDAVKVEQSGNELGGPLRIRGKRGLWGSWAETEAGGEIATQSTQVAA